MKILKILVMMVSILAGSVFIMPSVSSAEDVWCYSEDEDDMSLYLDSDTVLQTKNQPYGI